MSLIARTDKLRVIHWFRVAVQKNCFVLRRLKALEPGKKHPRTIEGRLHEEVC